LHGALKELKFRLKPDMNAHHNSRKGNSMPRQQLGFSLLEVMVAVFVLSIGLLGVAGLQHTSKRSNFEAVQRSTATMLAEDIIERIRSNAGQLTVYTSNGAGRTLTGSTMTATNCATAACTNATVASYDLYEFEQALIGATEVAGTNNTGGLAFPTACITGPAVVPGEVTVAIAWRGLTRLANPTINTCGDATGNYDDGAAANVFRRVLVVTTFIDD